MGDVGDVPAWLLGDVGRQKKGKSACRPTLPVCVLGDFFLLERFLFTVLLFLQSHALDFKPRSFQAYFIGMSPRSQNK